MCLLAAFVCGILTGRWTIETGKKTEYVKGNEQTGSIGPGQLEPVKEEKPEGGFLPVKTDTVIIDNSRVIMQSVDTAGIIADYELKRSYNITAFDNKEYGKLELFPVVQYNKLSALDYKYLPIKKQTTVRKERIFQPFVSGNYSTFNYWSIGGGFFYYNIGIEYQYQQNFPDKESGHSFGIKYKF